MPAKITLVSWPLSFFEAILIIANIFEGFLWPENYIGQAEDQIRLVYSVGPEINPWGLTKLGFYWKIYSYGKIEILSA